MNPKPRQGRPSLAHGGSRGKPCVHRIQEEPPPLLSSPRQGGRITREVRGALEWRGNAKLPSSTPDRLSRLNCADRLAGCHGQLACPCSCSVCPLVCLNLTPTPRGGPRNASRRPGAHCSRRCKALNFDKRMLPKVQAARLIPRNPGINLAFARRVARSPVNRTGRRTPGTAHHGRRPQSRLRR